MAFPASQHGLKPPGDLSSRAGRALVEAEMVASVGWLIRLRWIAGICVLIGTWLVGAFGLQAAVGPLYAIGAGILFYNLVFFLVERQLTQNQAPARFFGQLAVGQAILDWLAMALLIRFSGGIESPAILFFIFHIIIASIFFPPRAAGGLALLAAGLLSGIVLLEMEGILPHHAIEGFLTEPLYTNRYYVMAVLFFFTSTALISAYLASTIQKRLRQREEEVVLLGESLRLATSRLQALNDDARLISSTLELPEVLNRLVSSTAQAMGVRACSIRLVDKSGRSLTPVAVYGLSQTYLDKGPVDPEINPLARKVLSGKIINIPDAHKNPMLQYPEAARQEGIRSVLSAPLTGKNQPLGILRAYAVEPDHFTAEDEAFLGAIAAQGSIAIENALAYQAIESLDAAKSQFIQIITHELRSPVSVIRSLLNTLTAGYVGQISGEQMDILCRATRRAEFLQKLIDDLLDLAAGKTDVREREVLEPVCLAEAIQLVVKRFEVPAREKNLALTWHDQQVGEPLQVMATPEGVDRILNNLISNAIKYTPPGGKVHVNLARINGSATIMVEDTGIGIPEEAIGHLFEEFFRAPNAKAVEREGTGLGLTIVKDQATRFGGRITVQSEVRKGSCFTLFLPLAGSSVSMVDPSEAKASPAEPRSLAGQ